MYTMYKCQNTWTYFSFFFFYLFDHFVITVFDCVKQLQRIGNLQYDVARVKCKNIFFAQIFAPIFYKILIRVKFNLPLPIILNYFYLFFSFLSAQNILVVKENLIFQHRYIRSSTREEFKEIQKFYFIYDNILLKYKLNQNKQNN